MNPSKLRYPPLQPLAELVTRKNIHMKTCLSMVVLQFSRTVAPDTSKGPALVAFMRHHKWSRAVLVTSTEGVWFESGLGLTAQLQTAGMQVLKPAAFEPNQFKATTLTDVKRSGIRIVLLLAFDDDTHTVASSAANEGMGNMGWAWIIPEERIAIQQMHGWLYFRPLLPSEGMQAFAEQVSEYAKSAFNITIPAESVDLTYSVALHNAIMLYAHAATKVLSEGGDLHDGLAVTAKLRSTAIEGVGGSTVALDEKGDMLESHVEVMNYVLGPGGTMGSVLVGMHNSTSKLQQYQAREWAIVWPGNTTEVPADYFSGGH